MYEIAAGASISHAVSAGIPIWMGACSRAIRTY
jgi:hypothetical protein